MGTTDEGAFDDVWVVVRPGRVPEQWRGRGIETVAIPLLPSEATALFNGVPPVPALGPEDEQVLHLVARAHSASAVARELGISTRGAQHRLARLRRRFNVQTTADLAVFAVRRGFGAGAGTNVQQRATGAGPNPANE